MTKYDPDDIRQNRTLEGPTYKKMKKTVTKALKKGKKALKNKG